MWYYSSVGSIVATSLSQDGSTVATIAPTSIIWIKSQVISGSIVARNTHTLASKQPISEVLSRQNVWLIYIPYSLI